jgi:hypothetical protein
VSARVTVEKTMSLQEEQSRRRCACQRNSREDDVSARGTVEKTVQVCLPKEKKGRRCVCQRNSREDGVTARGTVKKMVCLPEKQ